MKSELMTFLGSLTSEKKKLSSPLNGFKEGRTYLESPCTCGKGQPVGREGGVKRTHDRDCPRLLEWRSKTGRKTIVP
jgi:hypothetical protein